MDIITGKKNSLWLSFIMEGESKSGLNLAWEQEHYLAGVLAGNIAGLNYDEAIALRYMWALQEDGRSTGKQRLLEVAHTSLLIAGLFPRLAFRRNVTPGYFLSASRSAMLGVARRDSSNEDHWISIMEAVPSMAVVLLSASGRDEPRVLSEINSEYGVYTGPSVVPVHSRLQ